MHRSFLTGQGNGNQSYELIVPIEHCVMALHSIVILALIAELSQSFCYLDKGFTRAIPLTE